MSQTTFTMTQVTCGFCEGTGKAPFDLLSELATCKVCKETGKVRIEEPTLRCAYCKSTGVSTIHGLRAQYVMARVWLRFLKD